MRTGTLVGAIACAVGLVIWGFACASKSGGGFTDTSNPGREAALSDAPNGDVGPSLEPAADDAGYYVGDATLIANGAETGGSRCADLKCRVPSCPDASSTSISGTIYDPAGKNPLYGVVAYVPNSAPAPIALGASCSTCSELYTGDPIATALTDPNGRFTIQNTPAGNAIPLVVQIGKWRKQYTIPSVTPCADNPQPDGMLRLPKNHSEGDLPNIAISTGAADTLECLLGRLGVDQTEYGAGGASPGRIHIFHGSGPGGAPNTSPPAPESSASLWDSTAHLMNYDIVLLSCEGDETAGANQQALYDYAGAGGRVFASHFHYAWFNSGPFGAAGLATWTPGANPMGDIYANVVTTLSGGQAFPKGLALGQWLAQVHALTNGELPIQAARHNADVGPGNVASQPWIVADQNATPPGATQYFTFETPIGVATDKQCGRVVFSDLHVGAASGDYGGAGPSANAQVPTGCANGDLSPQEKALEFMLFDLSACLTPDNQPPEPPQVVR